MIIIFVFWESWWTPGLINNRPYFNYKLIKLFVHVDGKKLIWPWFWKSNASDPKMVLLMAWGGTPVSADLNKQSKEQRIIRRSTKEESNTTSD